MKKISIIITLMLLLIFIIPNVIADAYSDSAPPCSYLSPDHVYKFNTGVLTVDCAGGYNITNSGIANAGNGKYNDSADMSSASSDTADKEVSNIGTSDFTINYWVNATSSAANGVVMYSGNSEGNSANRYAVRILGGVGDVPEILYAGGTGQILGTLDVVNGSWNMVTYVRKDTYVAIYVNGVLDVNSSFNHDLDGSDTQTCFGQNACTNENPDVDIDDLRIWKSTALTQTQIRDLYNYNPPTLTLTSDYPAGEYYKVGTVTNYTGYINLTCNQNCTFLSTNNSDWSLNWSNATHFRLYNDDISSINAGTTLINVTANTSTINTTTTINLTLVSYNSITYFYIRDGDGNLLTSVSSVIESTDTTIYSNPVPIFKSGYTNGQQENLTITDSSGVYAQIKSTQNIFYHINEVNITMSNKVLFLSFSEPIDIILQDRLQTTNYTNRTELSFNQTSIPEGKVVIWFGRNGTEPFEQRVEYINDRNTEINESIFILGNTDVIFWGKVVDMSNAPRRNAIVNVYQTNTSWLNLSYRLTSRVLTDDEGYFNVRLDPNLYTKINISLEDYSQSTDILTRITSNNTKDTAEVIKMLEVGNRIFTYVPKFPQYFINRSQNIYGIIEYPYGNTIEFQTDFMSIRQGAENEAEVIATLGGDPLSIYVLRNLNFIQLEPGIHFNESGTSNITMNIYANSALIDTFTIPYLDLTLNSYADIGSETFDSEILRPLLFTALILMSVAIQFIIKKPEGTIGRDTFFILSVFICFISIDFLPLGIISVLYWVLTSLKPLIGVTA